MGVILYILVTAVPPFDGENDKEIIEAVRKMQYTFDSKIYLLIKFLRWPTSVQLSKIS
jgi:hypothetical protein